MSKYDDILHHERPTSPNHKPLSREARAAQFAPYAALTGHRDIIANNEDRSLTQADPEYIVVLDDTEEQN